VSNGVLLFAHNNNVVDYVAQAVFCAKRVKEYMHLPVSIVTDATDFVGAEVFDKVIFKEVDNAKNFKLFKDSDKASERDNWYNTDRFHAYRLTPYEQTIVMDTDFIISNNNLNNLFESNKSFACSKKHTGIHTATQESTVDKISINSIPMYWATVMFFKKSKIAAAIFDLVEHIHDNWLWYKNLYGMNSAKFRNDYAFSIAIHTLQNFTESVNDFEIPYTQYNSFDVDDVVDFDKDNISILSRRGHNDYQISYFSGINVHIMNKFALEKIISESI
jgi:hypothetical protein